MEIAINQDIVDYLKLGLVAIGIGTFVLQSWILDAPWGDQNAPRGEGRHHTGQAKRTKMINFNKKMTAIRVGGPKRLMGRRAADIEAKQNVLKIIDFDKKSEAIEVEAPRRHTSGEAGGRGRRWKRREEERGRSRKEKEEGGRRKDGGRNEGWKRGDH